MTARGVFVTIEGIDGVGKSTQAEILARRLADRNVPVLRTREPGGSQCGEALRGLLKSDRHSDISRLTEILLFTAARRDHIEKTVLPALDAGKVVLCDRFVDSTRVYQGREHRDTIDWLHERFIGLDADLTFVLDLPESSAEQRTRHRGEQDWRLKRVGDGADDACKQFRELALLFPERCRLIDASMPREEVADQMLAELLKKLQ